MVPRAVPPAPVSSPMQAPHRATPAGGYATADAHAHRPVRLLEERLPVRCHDRRGEARRAPVPVEPRGVVVASGPGLEPCEGAFEAFRVHPPPDSSRACSVLVRRGVVRPLDRSCRRAFRSAPSDLRRRGPDPAAVGAEAIEPGCRRARRSRGDSRPPCRRRGTPSCSVAGARPRSDGERAVGAGARPAGSPVWRSRPGACDGDGRMAPPCPNIRFGPIMASAVCDLAAP